jgi:hypothetical protein
MSQSWEYYQQTEAGNQIQLYWICGLPTAVLKLGIALVSPGFPLFPRDANDNTWTSCLWAVPFDILKAVSVSKMLVTVNDGGRGGVVNLAIYQNVSATNNFPGRRVTPQNLTINIGNPAGVKEVVINPPVALTADTRYWVWQRFCRIGSTSL